MRTSLALLVLALAAGAASAEPSVAVDARRIEPVQFNELVDVLEQEMGAGGRYEYVQEREREAVRRELATMQALLEGRRALTELSADQRVELFNAQERANAILTRRDRDRRICQRRSAVGTHTKQVHCETYGEQMARKQRGRDKTRDLLERQQQCAELTTGPVAGSGNAGVQCF